MTKIKEESVNTVTNKKATNMAPVSQPFDFEDFFERNKKIIAIAGITFLALVGIFFGIQQYLKSQNAEAQEKMFQAQFYFRSDSLDLALKGRGRDKGFLQIKDEYPYTDAANLSSYYAGVIYLQKGDFKNAAAQLKDFSSNDVLVQARAYSLIGDAYMEQNNFADAKAYYLKAADYKPNKEFTPEYLYKLAIACEKSNDFQGAIDAYDKIIKDYPLSDKSSEAKKYKAYNEEKLVK